MKIGDKVKANWKRVYPPMTGEITELNETTATINTQIGKIEFPLTSLKITRQ